MLRFSPRRPSMLSKHLAIALWLVVVGLGNSCFGEPPNESGTVEQLRREVAELKELVNVLRERLNELEYQGLPRALRLSPRGEAPVTAPVGYLRFPLDVERGTAIPTRRNRPSTLR
jgi:hypothetical protein